MFPVLCRSFALFHLSVHLKLGEKQKWYFMLFQNISVSVVLDEKVIGFKYLFTVYCTGIFQIQTFNLGIFLECKDLHVTQ